MENIFKSSISLDLGAQYTGVFLANHLQGTPVTSGDTEAFTLVMPPDGAGLRYSVQSRRAARHRMRGNKRFSMARRLLRQIVVSQLSATNTVLSADELKKLFIALSGLLKRRGYSRTESETDLTPLDEADPSFFADHRVLSAYFSGTSPLADQWEEISGNLQTLADFNRNPKIPVSKCFFKRFFLDEFPELRPEIDHYTTALQCMRDDAKNILEAQTFGHKHRSEYLQAIRSDMERDTRLTRTANAFGGIDRLWRLVGNLSNLQLRAERWYFNAPFMLTEDKFDPKRLHRTIVRAYEFFHPDPEKSAAHRQLIQKLKNAKDIVECLCELDPNETIPPYEDQNNRRPPVDQTLYLSPAAMTACYGDVWKSWAKCLRKKDTALGNDLDEILASPDRKSRIPALGGNPLPSTDYELSYILQRAMDRSKSRDPYSLRLLSQPNVQKTSSVLGALDALASTIGSQHVKAFLGFAGKYYAEVQRAHSGLWSVGADNLLERADIHPPMKKKVLSILVGGVLGGDDILGSRFISEVWHERVTGRTTVQSACRDIENQRKIYGGSFLTEFRRACWLVDQGRNVTDEQRQLAGVQHWVEAVSHVIATKLGLPNDAAARFANPFSLAQFYTLIEEERMGFASTTKAAFLENTWRMTRGEDSDLGAQCSRLPADSVRPFDGMLRRLLDRQAWELAKLMSAGIQKKVQFRNGKVDVGILIEENRFDFSASLLDIKRSLLTKSKFDAKTKQLKQGRERQTGRWEEKSVRIRNASAGICPYTGRPLGDGGELDHIIPRSRTTKQLGTIFNTEANLIFVSREGNQRKADQAYYLEDLNSEYLRRQFETADTVAVEGIISETVVRLERSGRLRHFDLLSTEEQKCVRHALFLHETSEARRAVENFLSSSSKTRVNGTQAWLVKTLIEKLQTELSAWCKKTGNVLAFESWAGDASTVHELRKAVGEIQPRLAKPEVQPVASHSVDAMCAYAAACGIESVRNFLDGDGELSRASQAGKLVGLYPHSCKVIRIEPVNSVLKKDIQSSPIFKEGIIAERFLPIILHGKEVFIGFGLPAKGAEKSDYSIPVTGKDPLAFVRQVLPYCKAQPDWNSDAVQTLVIDRQKAFGLLEKASRQKDLSAEELGIANLLESLWYCEARKPISSVLLDQTGKLISVDDWNKKRSRPNFLSITLKGSAKAFSAGPSNLYGFSGSILLPAVEQWNRLYSRFSALPGGKIGDDVFNLMAEERKAHSPLKHAKTRRVWSLPILGTASGLFRIRRKSGNGEPLLQACNISSAKYIGFQVKDDKGSVNWSAPVVRSSLNSGDVVPVGNRAIAGGRTALMTDWRLVYDDQETTIWMCLNSESRCRIRARIPSKQFLSLVDESIGDAMSCKAELEAPRWKDGQLTCRQLMGEPRSKLFIEEVGDTVCFSYIVTRKLPAITDAYDRGTV